MSIKFNPFTGTVDYIGDASTNVNPYKVDKFTLSGTDITNKYIVLSEAPTTKTKTRLVVIGGPEHDYSIDFQVTIDDGNKRLSWDGLALQPILENSDKIIVIYN